ncbi:MAG: hypothetical protein J2P45_20285 [Candidatus Dormibacteraeota bacterium]|nr:hypothetical protein [Candidatus Dormibacteraeota bacterium]
MTTTPSQAVRAALARSAGGRDADALEALAAEVETAVRRQARVEPGPPPLVALVEEGDRGPWLGYLFEADAGRCWLALGWTPPAEAAAVRQAVTREFTDQLGSARVGPLPQPMACSEAVVVSRAYDGADLPSGHDLVNDLHAMVMLHDLLGEGF